MDDEDLRVAPVDGGQAPEADGPPKPPGVIRRTGFAWGLAAGAVLVVVLVLATVLFLYFRITAQYSSVMRGAPVAVSPVTAGTPWFTVSADGTGSFEGWSEGSSSSGDGSGLSFTVYNVGSIDGIPVRHVVEVSVDEDTAIFEGSTPYVPKQADSKQTAIEQVFGFTGESGETDLSESKLRIDFKRTGDRLYATKVTIIRGSSPPPDFQY